MRKVKKQIIPLILIFLMTVGLSTNALAAETHAINVQLGESLVSFADAGPAVKVGHIYVPDDSVFSALGAQYTYDDATKTATAVRGNITVKFTDGQSSYILTQNGAAQTIEMDAAPYMLSGHFMIPVRYEAAAFGCSVGWDADQNTVLILDVDSLLSSASYTLMDKYLAYNNKLEQTPYTFSGTFSLSLNVTVGGTAVPIVSNGRITGISDSSAANMNLTVSTNLKNLMSALSKMGELDESTQEAFKMLQNINVSYIINLAENKIYMKSPLLSEAMGVEQDAWIMLDLNDMLNFNGLSMPFTALSLQNYKADSMRDILKRILNAMPLTSTSDAANIKEAMAVYNSFFGDDAFVKISNTYVNKNTIAEDGMNLTYHIVFIMEGNKVIGYNMTMQAAGEDTGSFDMTCSMNKSYKMNLNMNFNVPEVLEAAFNMDMQYSPTKNTPKSAPDSGSTIIPFENN